MIKRILNVDQLHLQIMFRNALNGNVKSFLFALFIALLGQQVLFGCHTQNRLERRNNALIRYLDHAGHALAQLHTLGRLRHNKHAGAQMQTIRVKII